MFGASTKTSIISGTGEEQQTISLDTKNPWANPPEYDYVKSVFATVGKLKARIDVLEIEIEEIERGIKRGSRKADTIDEAKEASKEKRLLLAQTRAELRVAEYELGFVEYSGQMFKSFAFNNR